MAHIENSYSLTVTKTYEGNLHQINGSDQNVYLQYAYMTKDKEQCVLMNINIEYNGITFLVK